VVLNGSFDSPRYKTPKLTFIRNKQDITLNIDWQPSDHVSKFEGFDSSALRSLLNCKPVFVKEITDRAQSHFALQLVAYAGVENCKLLFFTANEQGQIRNDSRVTCSIDLTAVEVQKIRDFLTQV
jgi:hypothetical protein